MPAEFIRTPYRVYYPDKNFFSTEKTGFDTGSEAMYYMLNDLVTIGAMTIPAVKFITSDSKQVTGSWPVTERLYKIVSGGVGYNVGDNLQLVGGGTATMPLNVTVSSVSATGAITGFTIAGGEKYASYSSINTSQPNPLEFATSNFVLANVAVANFKIAANVTSSTGSGKDVVPPTTAPISADEGSTASRDALVTQWANTYGVKGSGFYANGTPSSNSRVYANVIWAFNSTITNLSKIQVGQKVFTTDSSGNMTFLANIATIKTVNVVNGTVNGITKPNPWTWRYTFSETTAPATVIYTDAPITLSKDTEINFQGQGATVDNTSTIVPAVWSVLAETTGVMDPMSDQVGVLGNVVASVTNSNTIQINNLTTSNAYNPVIYEGQTVTNFDVIGTGVSGLVTVVNVVMTSTTTANVVLSNQQTLSQDKRLRFAFDPIQPYRMIVEVQNDQTVNLYFGTSVQFRNDLVIPPVLNTSQEFIDFPGLVGLPPTRTLDRVPGFIALPSTGQVLSVATPVVNPDDVTQGFINRMKRLRPSTGSVLVSSPTGAPNTQQYYGGASMQAVSNDPSWNNYLNFYAASKSYPINTLLTITDRGMFFGVWEGNFATLQKTGGPSGSDNFFNWVLVQRPVNRVTGKIMTTGRAPVFCINSVGYKYHKFIVRESDVFHPTMGEANTADSGQEFAYRVPADRHSNDSFALLNTTNQIALTEDSKYLVSFLHNLTTPRFRYSDELDMIGQTSADVCMAGNDISFTAYTESGPRKYKALPSNKPYNTGLRIVVIKDIT